jgi:hypothetical protein
VLEVDLEAGALAGDARAAELGRILRYRGGAMNQVQLAPGNTQALHDRALYDRALYDRALYGSDDTEVGAWRVVAS